MSGASETKLAYTPEVAAATRELYALALAEGFRGQDIVALLAMYQNWAKPA